tara:strand:- start:255 stop:908 length:654 start_codon:yes stop_codon:yes gene_type:complete
MTNNNGNNGNKGNKKGGFLNGFNLGNAASSAGYWYGLGYMVVLFVIGIVLLVVGNKVMKHSKNNSYSVKFSAPMEGSCSAPMQTCGRRGCSRMKYKCSGTLQPGFIVPIPANDGVVWKTDSIRSYKTSYTPITSWNDQFEGDPTTGHIRPKSMGRTGGILMIVFGSVFVLSGFGMIGCLRNRSCRQGLGAAGVAGNMFGGSSSGYNNYSMFNPMLDL